MKIMIPFLIIISLFYSCESPVFTVELEKRDPKLVINSQIRPDCTIVAYLTSSWSSLEQDKTYPVEDAIVEIFEEDNLICNLTHDQLGYYLQEENPLKSGSSYLIKANAPGYGEVSCSLNIPKKIAFSVDTITKNSNVSDGFYEWQREYLEFKINFTDPVDEENYYIIKIYTNVVDYGYNEYQEIIDTFEYNWPLMLQTDDISAEFGITNYPPWIYEKEDYTVYGWDGICYRDLLFPGKDVTFTLLVDKYSVIPYYPSTKTLYVYVESITRDYYLLLKSLGLYEKANDDPLAQNVNVYTNVENGYGLIGAYSVSVDSFKMPQQERDTTGMYY